MTAEEVAAAALYLKDTLGQENLQELISKLAKDEGMGPHCYYAPSTLIWISFLGVCKPNVSLS